MRRRFWLAAACAASLVLALPAAALGAHSLRFTIGKFEPAPSRFEYLEGPCGAAVDSHGDLYVSDYYHNKIDVFGSSGSFITQIAGVSPLDGPCGLAVDSSGRIYAEAYHQGVLELTPSSYPPTGTTSYSAPATVIGDVDATGVALDPTSGNLLVDERTAVAEYEAPVAPGAEPLRRIGVGSLEDGYGVAASGYPATDGFVYVADADSSSVKVYDPATSLTEPVATIDGEGTALGRFNDLLDAALAVDDSDGHLYVADNVDGPLFEHPRATVVEFNDVGQPRDELEPVVDGDPVGLAVDDSGKATEGDLYLTSGNTEGSELLAFGPTSAGHSLTVSLAGSGGGDVVSDPAGIRCGGACIAEFDAGSKLELDAKAAPGSTFTGWSGPCAGTGPCLLTMSTDLTVTAQFEPTPLIDLTASESGRSASGSTSSSVIAPLRATSSVKESAGETRPTLSAPVRRHRRVRHRHRRQCRRAHRRHCTSSARRP